VICYSGGPLDVIAETEVCWVTAQVDAPLPGYDAEKVQDPRPARRVGPGNLPDRNRSVIGPL